MAAVFIQQVVDNAINGMIPQLLFPLRKSDSQVNSPAADLHAQQLQQMLERIIKRATGLSLAELLQENLSYRDFENMLLVILKQELSNCARNMEMTLLNAYGISSKQVGSHYNTQSGLSLHVENVLDTIFNTNYNAYDDNSNPNSNARLYRHQIQRHIHAVLDGMSQSAMRQALRDLATKSLEKLDVVAGTNLESFARHKKQHHEKAMTGLQDMQTLGQQARALRFAKPN